VDLAETQAHVAALVDALRGRAGGAYWETMGQQEAEERDA
jgi:hypothetical protein